MHTETLIRDGVKYIQIQNPKKHPADNTRDNQVVKFTEQEALECIVSVATLLGLHSHFTIDDIIDVHNQLKAGKELKEAISYQGYHLNHAEEQSEAVENDFEADFNAPVNHHPSDEELEADDRLSSADAEDNQETDTVETVEE